MADLRRTATLALDVPPPRTGRMAVLASCGTLIVLFGGVFLLCFTLEVLVPFINTPGLAMVSAVSAVTLGAPYLAAVLWLDRNEKEPPALLLSAFAWGAVMAAGISGQFNATFLDVAAGITGDEAMSHQLMASFSAPFIE
jgi:hypothetical protein